MQESQRMMKTSWKMKCHHLSLKFSHLVTLCCSSGVVLIVIVIHVHKRGWLRQSGSCWRGGECWSVWKSSGESRKHSFIKVGSVRQQELLADWIEELPPFELSRVTHKDRFLHVWRQSRPLVLLDMHICGTAKHSHQRQVWKLAVHEREGYLTTIS